MLFSNYSRGFLGIFWGNVLGILMEKNYFLVKI